jgi:DNA-directed RNA polymerase subunit RPC12/RpoP
LADFTAAEVAQPPGPVAAPPGGYAPAPDPDGGASGEAAFCDYTCESCGAVITADPNEAAGKCPYCRSPIVLTAQVGGQFAPNLVIPFSYTREQAVDALRQLYQGKRLLPKVFSEQNFVDEVKGVYIPFWLFDFQTQVWESFKGVNKETRTSGSKKYITTYEYQAVRQGTAAFRGIPVDGSRNMPDAIMESIQPFDLSAAVAFQPNYLSGFLAERYDVSAEQAEVRARERVDQTGGQVFAHTVSGYQAVSTQRAQVQVTNRNVVYALLPVWMLTTIWRGQRFTFAMNGQTGRMVGDLPLDRAAYWRWFALLGGGTAAAAAVIAFMAVFS